MSILIQNYDIMYEAKEIEETLLDMFNEKQRNVYMNFFQTGKGQYGEGDKFLGIRNPQLRKVVGMVWKKIEIEEVIKLIHSQWHEVRLCGLLIMTQMMLQAVKRNDDVTMHNIYNVYTAQHKYINNWDLVDLSATIIAGWWETLHPDEQLLDEWIKTPESSMWQKRIAMVSCWRLVRNGRYDEITRRAEVLIASKEDLLHKAAGWMLRELGKSSMAGMERLEQFLDMHADHMPSVMMRYAIEKMSPSRRKYWLDRRVGLR